MKKQGTPGGLALGHASGDANGWVHWCLWAHGGNLVDKNDKVIINSPETEKALDYCKKLYEEMIPGTASWNDASNNKAFLAGEIHWTNNGISIYVAATNDPTKKNIAEDMDHAYFPVGPIGKPTELHLMYPLLAMTLHQVSAGLQGADGVHAGGGSIQRMDRSSRRAILRTVSMPTTTTRSGPPIPSARHSATSPSAR